MEGVSVVATRMARVWDTTNNMDMIVSTVAYMIVVGYIKRMHVHCSITWAQRLMLV